MRKRITLPGSAVLLALVFALQFASCSGGGGGGSSTDTASSGGATQYNSDDVANAAIASLGSDTEASTAILMALAKDAGLEQIVAAIMAGTLDANGNIAATARLADICENPDDEDICNQEIDNRIIAWESLGRNERLTGIILRAGARGYSADQITTAITAMSLGMGGGIESGGRIISDRGSYLTPQYPIVSIFTDVDTSDGGTGTGDTGGGDGTDTGGDDSGGTLVFPAYYKDNEGSVTISTTIFSGAEAGSLTCTARDVVFTFELRENGDVEWDVSHTSRPYFTRYCEREVGLNTAFTGVHANGSFSIDLTNGGQISGTYDASFLSGSGVWTTQSDDFAETIYHFDFIAEKVSSLD